MNNHDQLDEALVNYLLGLLNVPNDRRLTAMGELGSGGAGEVSAVFDKVLHRNLARKTLLDAARTHPLLLRSFIREAQIMGQLDHPNIVPVHDLALDADSRPYFTMKRVEGQTLADLIDPHAAGPLHIDRGHAYMVKMLGIFLKVCDALAFAHSRGVIHCDIKAQNILVGNFGQVYLTDWGGAQLLPERPGQHHGQWVKDLLPQLPLQVTEGFVFGSPAYMSPEQALGHKEQVDERSDIFSLGALLYQMLSGRPPYVGDTMLQTMLLAQKGVFPPISAQMEEQRSLRPRELIRIVTRAMAPRPEDRYPGVIDLQTDLEQFLRGGGDLPTRHVLAGEHIIIEGEVAHSAYIIRSGECEVYTMIDGQRMSLQRLGERDVFGETALLSSPRRTASVVALTDMTLLVVTGDTLGRELVAMKPWMADFMRTLASRFRKELDRRLQRNVSAEVVAPSSESPGPEIEDLCGQWWKFW